MVLVGLSFGLYWPWIILSGVLGAVVAVIICKRTGGGSKSVEDAKPSTKRSLILGIKENASDFAELYDPTFYLAAGSANHKEEIFAAWHEIVANGQYAQDFKDAFAKEFSTKKFKNKDKKYIKLADELLKIIFKAGVVRSNVTEVIADETTAEKYDTAGIVSLETGMQYDVLAPYWYMQDQIFVKGVLR